MARINFEDDVEAQDEFWNLLPLVGGDRDRALGRLIRFFRIAQKAYGQNVPMEEQDLRDKGFADMIESGWAVPVSGGYQALGAEVHFDWYRQKVDAGRRGGLAKAENAKKALAETSVATAGLADAYPLAPAPVPALSPAPIKKEKKEEGNPISQFLEEARKTWLETLVHLKAPRERLAQAEEVLIAQAISRHGGPDVILALLGARDEPAFDGFDPRKNIDLSRVLTKNPETGKERILKFIGLGAQIKKKIETQAALEAHRRAEELEFEEEPAVPDDPERVKEIMGKWFKGIA